MIYGGGGYARVSYAATPATGSTNGAGNLTQSAGVGVAGGVTPQVGGLLTQAVGIGVAAGISSSEFAFLLGAAGVGVAGNATSSASTSSLAQAAGIGVAGQFFASISGILSGAIGIGVAGQIRAVISGGGGNWKRNTGLEPVKKRPRAPPAYVEPKLPLPPFKRAPALAPADLEPIELVDHKPPPGSFLDLEAKIHSAEDISDVQMFLAHLEQDEQDADDIADVLALLEAED